MDPISIALALAQFVPSITKMITGSDKAEKVAATVVDIAKAVTKQQSGEDAISAMKQDPALVLEYQKAILAKDSELNTLVNANASDINKTMQAEAAAEHWPTYSWRPFIGFSFGAYLSAQWIMPMLGKAPPVVDPQLMLVVGSILGIASYFRGAMQANPSIPTVNRG